MTRATDKGTAFSRLLSDWKDQWSWLKVRIKKHDLSLPIEVHAAVALSRFDGTPGRAEDFDLILTNKEAFKAWVMAFDIWLSGFDKLDMTQKEAIIWAGAILKQVAGYFVDLYQLHGDRVKVREWQDVINRAENVADKIETTESACEIKVQLAEIKAQMISLRVGTLKERFVHKVESKKKPDCDIIQALALRRWPKNGPNMDDAKPLRDYLRDNAGHRGTVIEKHDLLKKLNPRILPADAARIIGCTLGQISPSRHK